MFKYNILTYGVSLIIKANIITILICKFGRFIDRVLEKIPIINQFCGQMIILIKK